MRVAVELTVAVAVTLEVTFGVVVTVVEAGFSRQVHTDPTKALAWAFRLLSCDDFGSTALAVTSDRFCLRFRVTVTVTVAVSVSVKVS